jgi:RND family efflux transporter MFP subunit
MEIDPIEPAVPAARPPQAKSRFLSWKWLLVPAAVIIGAVALEYPRGNTRAAQPASPVTVAVAKVTREDLARTVKISAEFRPYQEVELHAKVSGYLSRINVDFGDQVKSNQLLATLEVPELRDQLHSAVATEQKAQADYTNAHLIFLRLQGVNHQYTKYTNIIAQQAIDTAEANDLSTAAAIAAAKADREKFETLVKYTQITAPFDGVITKRYADPGALIQSGTASDTQSMPLVRISDNYRLRMDFYVDVDDVKDIHVGDAVEVRVDSLGGRTFTGKISRCTYRVEQDTRKMTTEIEVPNPQLELVPGMYATVVLKLDRRPQTLAIPAQAVAAGKKNTVYVVNDSGQIEERQVTFGLETPDKFEVTSGLKEGELVLIGGHALARAGEKVEPKLVEMETAL